MDAEPVAASDAAPARRQGPRGPLIVRSPIKGYQIACATPEEAERVAAWAAWVRGRRAVRRVDPSE